MRRRALLMSGKSEPNTIIGGVGSVITTKSALATKLGISESIIKRFEVVDSDVHCRISTNYFPKEDAFRDDYTIDKYLDLDGLILGFVNNGVFRNSGVEELYLPNLSTVFSYSIAYCQYLKYLTLPSWNITTWSGSMAQSIRNNTGLLEFNAPIIEKIGDVVAGGQNNFFDSYSSCNLISMRKLKVYGNPSSGTTGNTSGFTALKMGCVIEVHENLATANAGTANTSLIWAKNNRGAIVEFYDDSGNYVSTL